MLAPLCALASSQAEPTEDMLKKTKNFLDHAASNLDIIFTYKASAMILAVYSDASYLYKLKAWSRAGGHFLMPNNAKTPQQWGYAQHYKDHQCSDDISNIGRTRSIVYQLTKSGIVMEETRRNGSSAIFNIGRPNIATEKAQI